MRTFLIPAVLAFVSSPLAGRSATEAKNGVQAQQTRTVYVSVTEKNGTPTTDLTAADFDVKAGGQPREVVSAQLTTTPIRMAIVVADGGTGAFQVAAATLVQQLQSVAEFALVSVVEQPERIVDYTNDLDAVVAGLKRMGNRTGKPTTGQLMEAIAETLKDARREGKRPVIVVMSIGGAASSSLRADAVREDLRKTSTVLYAISPVGGGAGRGAAAGGGGSGNMGAARTDYAASESASRGRDLEVVLNDGSKESGGRHDQVNGQALIKAVEQICQELLNQYQLSYVAPDGVKPGDRLEVSSKRKGVKVNAPSRVAS
jgi:VWFA-related protein